MPMIQGIDGATLINALRAGRDDRYEEDRRKAEAANAEAEGAHRRRVQGLIGQLFGEQPQGVAGQFGAPEPQSSPFDQAFNPQSMEAIGRGEDPGPVAAPAPAQATAQPPRRQVNRDVLTQLVLLDPETGGRIASALKTMADDDLDRAEARNSHMGATARWLRQFPPQERPARLEAAAPLLLEQGFTPEQIQNAGQDLSDQQLGLFEMNAIDYDALIDNERAEREAGLRQEDREADNARANRAAARADRNTDSLVESRRAATRRGDRTAGTAERRETRLARGGGRGRSGGGNARPRSWGADWRTATGAGGARIAYNPRTRKWVDEAGKPVS